MTDKLKTSTVKKKVKLSPLDCVSIQFKYNPKNTALLFNVRIIHLEAEKSFSSIS